ncbi:MAG: TIM barrel protein [Chloroflexi bacterium]|nr:TIM barrel protein [Chloroflexota bacterium]
MHLAANSGIFGRPLDWDERILAASELGYAGIELNIDANALLPRMWDQARRAAVRALAARSGVTLTSLCMNCHWAFNLASPDARVREIGVDLLHEAIALAVDLGIPTILAPACDTQEATTAAPYPVFRRSLARCLPEAERAGVRVAIEAVNKPFLLTTHQIRGLIDELASPCLGIYLDVGNAAGSNLSGDHEIREAADLALACHLKDTGGRFFGEGTVDFDACLAALREIGYTGYLTVELAPDPVDPRLMARRAKDWLDAHLEV